MVGDTMAQDFAKAFYSTKEWISLRFNLIQERGPICQHCGKIMIDTAKLIGHHKVHLTPQNINDVNITLNPEKIELTCTECHSKEPGHFAGSRKHEIYLVYGAPCSGKLSMVNQLVERGDMILDLDKIFECISGMPLYDKPDNLRFNVFALRDKMIDMVKTRYGKWHNAYIVGGYPAKIERERLARELGAELIYCESTKEECYSHALLCDANRKEWQPWIDKWFELYQE